MDNQWCFRPSNGRTVIHVLRVGDYEPEVCRFTLPSIERYAVKIGATVNVLTERRFPEWPLHYEKMQVYDAGAENEWNVYLDADAMIHPDMFDLTKIRVCPHVPDEPVPRNAVGMHYGYEQNLADDKFFRRYAASNLRGMTAFLVVANNLCHDVWTPLELSPAQVESFLFNYRHVDEYCLSRNMCRFGLRNYHVFPELYMAHLIRHLIHYDFTPDEKAKRLREAQRLSEEWFDD